MEYTVQFLFEGAFRTDIERDNKLLEAHDAVAVGIEEVENKGGILLGISEGEVPFVDVLELQQRERAGRTVLEEAGVPLGLRQGGVRCAWR